MKTLIAYFLNRTSTVIIDTRTWFLFSIIFFLYSGQLFAQDTLYNKNGTKLVANIVQANSTQVKFKLDSVAQTTIYAISRDALLRIVYRNGTIDSMPVETNKELIGRMKDPRVSDYYRNFFFLNAFDLFYESITVGYEHIFNLGAFSVKVPVSLGFTTLGFTHHEQKNFDEQNYYNRNKIYSVGLDLSFYPVSQGTIRYFLGPSLEYGQVNSWHNESETNSLLAKDIGYFYAYLIQNGVLFQPLKNLNFSLNFGAGYCRSKRHYDRAGYSGNIESIKVSNEKAVLRAGLLVGYKF
ncbi:hypothetical protein BH11BAC1_BH11BAC1_18570 [soil metagenome]